MSGMPDRYVVVDTETTWKKEHPKKPDLIHTLRLGVARICDPHARTAEDVPYWQFEHAAEFHALLAAMPPAKDPIFVYAHNMGFDARILDVMGAVVRGIYSLEPPPGTKNAARYKEPLMILDSPPFILRLWRPDGQRIMFYDTYQWFRASLKDIGDMLSLPKGDMPPEDAPLLDWFTYCRRDVDVLHAALVASWRWLERLRVKSWMPTIASQSMLIYKTRYECGRIRRPDDLGVHALDRLGYYGATFEVYRHGQSEGPIYHLDINSLYPRVMKNEPFPVEIVAQGDHSDAGEIPPRFRAESSTAEVYLDSNVTPYPVKGCDETIWCTGLVRTVLSGPELVRAIENGDVVRIGRYTTYKLANLFGDFVVKFWRERSLARKRGDRFIERLSKDIMNCLHGKFGQRSGEWVYRPDEYERMEFCQGVYFDRGSDRACQFRRVLGKTYTRILDLEDPRSFVPIAAWCTSHARVYMDDMRQIADPDHVLYQANDALLVDGVGLGNLQLAGMVDGDELGLFKLKETYKWINIHSVNQYDTDLCDVRAGIKKGAREIAPGIFECEDWQAFLAGICRGELGFVRIGQSLRKRSTYYGRRHIGKGGRTVPYRVHNWHLSPEEQHREPALACRVDRE